MKIPTFVVKRSPAEGEPIIMVSMDRAGANAIADVILQADGDEYDMTSELGIQLRDLLYQIRKQG